MGSFRVQGLGFRTPNFMSSSSYTQDEGLGFRDPKKQVGNRGLGNAEALMIRIGSMMIS